MEEPIPNEVAVIAQELGIAFHGCPHDGLEHYTGLAFKIYDRLLKEQKAAINAQLAPDD